MNPPSYRTASDRETAMEADARNAEQVEFWNGPGGRHWIKLQEMWDIVLGPVGMAIFERAAVRPGERVIDIGCGCGGTTIELGQAVGRTGEVLGLDISAPMLARAGERRPKGMPIQFLQADATTHPLSPGHFDLLFSRFGVMFFAEPARAFANLRRGLKPKGRLAFSCFRDSKDNPWMLVPLKAAYEHVPPLPKLGPEDPGPFAFASEERVRRILGDAGFGAIRMEPVDLAFDLAAGRGLDAAVAATLEIGATSRAVDGQPPAVRDAVAASVRKVLAPYQRGPSVPLPAALWIVTAINP
jgi:ubiquinone/menaquinone biosynthesis C-methylase UbiE